MCAQIYSFASIAIVGRQAVRAWGLTLCTKKPEWKSDTVTAVVVPSWIDSNEIVKIAYKKYNLSLGVGLNKIAGKVFRIGHLGNVNEVFPISFLLHCLHRLNLASS